MKIRCGCKVNLYLRIMGKHENGYHDLDTLFYPLQEPFDVLEITENIGEKVSPEENSTGVSKAVSIDNIQVQCETKGIDLDDNTLTKAYHLYAQKTSFAPKIRIRLEKGIPHGAGLGGGSSDAATLLTYLQQKNPNPLPVEKLRELAAKIGADVPFFLINTPCKAKGIGEILEPITLEFGRLYLVLISPCLQINTKWAFSKIDQEKKDLTAFPAFDKNHRSCFDKDLPENSSGDFLRDFFWQNDFEAPIFSEYPFLGEIKEELIKNGACVALLSGSGSSIFGLFRSLEAAKRSTVILKKILNEKNSVKVYDPIEVI